MKRYTTTYSNGHTDETSSAHEANCWQNYDDAQTFAIAGKSVPAAEFYAAVRGAIQAAWDRKSETHKRVRKLHGSSVGCYVETWVRK